MNNSKLLSSAEAASLLGLSPYTMRLWRHLGKGPRYVKLGATKQACVVYDEAEVMAFREKRTFTSTSAATVSHPGNA
ncbi:helix-turn-helix domain-containing protein [Sandaracinobacter sp. RS1-74]|uniref:helix-turn-helix transcriptional regulator n=1 Tax=Sandaracinobacteroides sayramensis TaxID=2913411 RepID=UPI001EDA6EC4|nr:helix-turn-helix domain-containing protein [Sandaracinobacteroides sayramensis]MCG2840186.1 helix-turn-helix domain-containing protein [Sandaracinobacteroides sayramensis]